MARTPDGEVAEVMVRMAKQGSTLAGMMDAFSSTVTRGLQHGVPLEVLVADYVGTRFEPAGLTNDPEIKQAGSVMDYVGRRLALDHLSYDVRVGLGVLTAEERAAKATLDGVGDAVWTDLVGLSMSAPAVTRPRRG
ncbi:TSCPD domain-containing protein [Streptomyces sp. NPDC001617]